MFFISSFFFETWYFKLWQFDLPEFRLQILEYIKIEFTAKVNYDLGAPNTFHIEKICLSYISIKNHQNKLIKKRFDKINLKFDVFSVIYTLHKVDYILEIIIFFYFRRQVIMILNGWFCLDLIGCSLIIYCYYCL